MQPRERGIFHGLKHGFDDQATDRICSARNHCEKEGDCVPLVPFFIPERTRKKVSESDGGADQVTTRTKKTMRDPCLLVVYSYS